MTRRSPTIRSPLAPLLVATYADGTGSIEEVRADTLAGILQVQRARQAHRLKPTCG